MNNYVRENNVREICVREYYKVRQKYWSISVRLFGISDLRSVNNCLKITAYDKIGGNESKTAFLDT